MTGQDQEGQRSAAQGSGDPFWAFSLSTYRRPGVEPACVSLQDRLGLDVNLLLYLCWAGSIGHALGSDELDEAMVRARRWQSRVVRPLREARRALKGQDMVPAEQGEALRERVKALELEAERLEQAMLRACLCAAENEASKDRTEAAARAARNIALYLRSVGVEPRLEDVADLAVVLHGSFPDVRPLEAVWMLRL